jgi:hypothetical protein
MEHLKNKRSLALTTSCQIKTAMGKLMSVRKDIIREVWSLFTHRTWMFCSIASWTTVSFSYFSAFYILFPPHHANNVLIAFYSCHQWLKYVFIIPNLRGVAKSASCRPFRLHQRFELKEEGEK